MLVHASRDCSVLGTVNHWTATARRSLSPANPTSIGRQRQVLASARATHCVLASRFRTFSRTCWPVPDGRKPRSSSTTKSSGSARRVPEPRAGPEPRGGSKAFRAHSSLTDIEKQYDCLSRDAFLATQKPQALGGRR